MMMMFYKYKNETWLKLFLTEIKTPKIILNS